TKGFLTARARLRHEPDPIPREQDGLPDVREVEEFLHEPIEPESPAAVRRHPVSERLQVELEVLRVQALLLHPRQEHVVSMLSLSSGGHLVSLVLEVERKRVVGFIRLRSEEHTSELQSRFDLVCRL